MLRFQQNRRRASGSSAGPTRPKPLHTLLREAELKARKTSGCGNEPDDVAYWDTIAKVWRTQMNIPANAPLPMDEHRATREATPFAKGTKYTLKRQGGGNDDEELVDLAAAKTKASNYRKDKYDDYRKCEAYFVNRHDIFVESLTGKAKDIYSGLLNDDATFTAYDRRSGWQKTNYVFSKIQKNLANPEKVSTMKQRYHTMRQHPGQSNEAYISVFEEKRRELMSHGYNISASEFREKILNTLNDQNLRHRTYFDAEGKSLQHVKDFLYNVDEQQRTLRQRISNCSGNLRDDRSEQPENELNHHETETSPLEQFNTGPLRRRLLENQWTDHTPRRRPALL